MLFIQQCDEENKVEYANERLFSKHDKACIFLVKRLETGHDVFYFCYALFEAQCCEVTVITTL